MPGEHITAAGIQVRPHDLEHDYQQPVGIPPPRPALDALMEQRLVPAIDAPPNRLVPELVGKFPLGFGQRPAVDVKQPDEQPLGIPSACAALATSIENRLLPPGHGKIKCLLAQLSEIVLRDSLNACRYSGSCRIQ